MRMQVHHFESKEPALQACQANIVTKIFSKNGGKKLYVGLSNVNKGWDAKLCRAAKVHRSRKLLIGQADAEKTAGIAVRPRR